MEVPEAPHIPRYIETNDEGPSDDPTRVKGKPAKSGTRDKRERVEETPRR